MPTKDEPIVSVRLSADLDRRLAAVADERKVRKSTAARQVLEEALYDGRATPRSTEPGSPASDGSPAVEPVQLYRCPRDCNPGWRPPAPIRCDFCRQMAVPV